MRVQVFEMERMQSSFEHEVEFNLTESGVLALRLEEILDSDAIASLAGMQLGYPEGPGSPELRANIASWHPGASEDQVTVVAGGAEANYTVLWTLMEPGDEAAIMIPNYMQTWGIVETFGRAVSFPLRPSPDNGPRWGLDVEELARAVTPRTKAIVVTNPNNPTGAVLSEAEMEAVVAAASGAGAWLVADEIYRGSEVDTDSVTPSFWGRYERVVVTGGLSKSFGLPGLRLGWTIAPLALTEQLRIHHDYLSIMPSILSDRIATAVTEPSRRDSILGRTRAVLRTNLPHLEEWIGRHGDVFDYIRPKAGAMAYVSARVDLDTLQLAERLRVEESTLIVPGEQLGLAGGFRLGYGHEIAHTLEGLGRVDRCLERAGVLRAR